MAVRGEGGPRRPGRARQPEDPPPARTRRTRERPSRPNLLPILAAVLLVVLLVVVALFLLRTLGDEVPGASVAEDSIESGREPRVEITNGPGSVRVEGTDGQRVEYSVTRYALAGDPAAARSAASEVPVDVAREDNVVTLRTDGGGETGADYSVRMPAAGRLEVEAEEGDVEVEGLDGNVTVRAESGDVTVRDATGDVTVEAESGDVTVGGMRTDTGNLELVVGSGDVSLEDLILGTLEASVETGDVTLSGRFSGEGRVSVETGDVTADLPSGEAAQLDLQTLVGDVSREPADEQRNEDQNGRRGG